MQIGFSGRFYNISDVNAHALQNRAKAIRNEANARFSREAVTVNLRGADTVIFAKAQDNKVSEQLLREAEADMCRWLLDQKAQFKYRG